MMTYIFTERALTVFLDGKVHTLHADDDRYSDAVTYVINDNTEALTDLLKPLEAVREYLSSNGRVEIKGNTVYFDGNPVANYMAFRILEMYREGHPIEPLIHFMGRVNDNPSKRAVDGLLQFLERGQLPITPDGCFLAYKRVKSDYTDVWSGNIDNSIGQVVTMPRNAVQDDPSITCSYGLHFCSLDYLGSFSGAKIMVLKIRPEDVVSIPSDYNMTKGRCCAYQVVSELESVPDTHNVWNTSVVSDYDEEEYEYEEDDDEYYEEDDDDGARELFLSGAITYDKFTGLWECTPEFGGPQYFTSRERAVKYLDATSRQ